MKLLEKLKTIQKELKAPKNQRNNFGNYNYRSCEDILEAVKPLLGDAVLTISDKVLNIGDRYYIQATATLQLGDEKLSVEALARESEEKKGMDSAQITGAASSYARKYALNGLFLIDDTKDADTMDNNIKEVKQQPVDTRKIEIVKLCKQLGFSGAENEKAYNMFIFTTIGEVLKEENYDKIIEKLTNKLK